MTEKTSNKITYISFILAIGVLFIHADNRETYSITSGIIYYFETCIWQFFSNLCVPMFFCISAFLLFRNIDTKNYKEKIKRRIKTLIIPYFIWNIIYYIFFHTISLLSKININIGNYSDSFSLYDLIQSIFLGKYNLVSWYLRCLIIYSVIIPYIYIRKINQNIYIY